MRDRVSPFRTRILYLVPALAITAISVEAQQATIAGPVTGYVFDSSAQSLRPILGLPGASLLGAPLDFGSSISGAVIAPRQDTAFLTTADGALHLFALNAASPAEITVSGLLGGAANPVSFGESSTAGRASRRPLRPSPSSQVVFSPSGTAAALYQAESIQVISGLPGSPAVAGSFHVGSAPDSFAVSDDGAVLLISADKSVRLIGSFADLGDLMDTTRNALLAFAPGTHDAAITDPAGAGVVLYHDLTGADTSQVLAPVNPNISAASAAAFSADGKSLLLASASRQSITALDVSAGSSNIIACSCSPTSLARMGSVFRLNELSSAPLWLLNPQPAQPQVLFVPALAQ
jgi:hypothetical protein